MTRPVRASTRWLLPVTESVISSTLLSKPSLCSLSGGLVARGGATTSSSLPSALPRLLLRRAGFCSLRSSSCRPRNASTTWPGSLRRCCSRSRSASMTRLAWTLARSASTSSASAGVVTSSRARSTSSRPVANLNQASRLRLSHASASSKVAKCAPVMSHRQPREEASSPRCPPPRCPASLAAPSSAPCATTQLISAGGGASGESGDWRDTLGQAPLVAVPSSPPAAAAAASSARRCRLSARRVALGRLGCPRGEDQAARPAHARFPDGRLCLWGRDAAPRRRRRVRPLH
mmetsp:Transcript_11943/g.39362  ORF Transcript_11943/g.39362 Transcript_11943/m.39362 type:complete len:290 (-) Transcript_11943:993-1862(-)